jgi:hypothetical protein
MVRTALPLILATRAAAQDADIYNQPPSTRLGCDCKESCSTSALFECDVDEFCGVESADCPSGKAAWSVTHGYYDWCEYKPYQPYESRSAAEKQALLLEKVVRDSSSGTYPGNLNVLTGIIGESVMLSFDAAADVFPHQRKKYIHSVGVVGGIRFDSHGGHPYMGLFEGAASGVVRFSSANEPGSSGFTPGMGIKFLRDGRKSANFVAMYTLDGQTCEERDFFQHEWSNHVPLTDNFGLKIVAAKFWQASYCPLMVGLSDLATTSDGPAARGSFPFQLIFKPLVVSDCDCQDYTTCLSNLASIAPGTALFEVFALASLGATRQAIGTITLTSQLSTSSFGDEQLFFQHQHMEDDFSIHPEWLERLQDDMKAQCGMSCASTGKPTIEQGCSSPFNGTALPLMLSSDESV